MSVFALVLVVLSAIIHASWNLLGKSRIPTPVFFCVASIGAGILLLPVMAVVLARQPILPVSFWLLLLASGFCQMVYMASLARAYQQADVGVVYPIARALPVLMVATVSSLLGQPLPASAWSGMVRDGLGNTWLPDGAHRLFSTLALAGLSARRVPVGITGGNWDGRLFSIG